MPLRFTPLVARPRRRYVPLRCRSVWSSFPRRRPQESLFLLSSRLFGPCPVLSALAGRSSSRLWDTLDPARRSRRSSSRKLSDLWEIGTPMELSLRCLGGIAVLINATPTPSRRGGLPSGLASSGICLGQTSYHEASGRPRGPLGGEPRVWRWRPAENSFATSPAAYAVPIWLFRFSQIPRLERLNID